MGIFKVGDWVQTRVVATADDGTLRLRQDFNGWFDEDEVLPAIDENVHTAALLVIEACRDTLRISGHLPGAIKNRLADYENVAHPFDFDGELKRLSELLAEGTAYVRVKGKIEHIIAEADKRGLKLKVVAE